MELMASISGGMEQTSAEGVGSYSSAEGGNSAEGRSERLTPLGIAEGICSHEAEGIVGAGNSAS